MPTLSDDPWLPDYIARWYDDFLPIARNRDVADWRCSTPRIVPNRASRLKEKPHMGAQELDQWIYLEAGVYTTDQRRYIALQAADRAIREMGIDIPRTWGGPDWHEIRLHWKRTGNLLRSARGLLLPTRNLGNCRWITPRKERKHHDPLSHFDGAFVRWRGDETPDLNISIRVLPGLETPQVDRKLALGVVPLVSKVTDFDWQTEHSGAALRFRVTLKNEGEILGAARMALEKAAKMQCDILVFPELCLTPKIQEELRRFFPTISRRYNRRPWLVVAGSAYTPLDGSSIDFHNRARAFDHDGRNVLEYHKLHPYEMSSNEEIRYCLRYILGEAPCIEDITPEPRSLQLLESPIGRIAILICEDLSVTQFVNPLVETLAVDWLLVPVLDGIQARNRWTADYAKIYSRLGAYVLVATSLSLVEAHRRDAPMLAGGFGLFARRNRQRLRIISHELTHSDPGVVVLSPKRR